MTTVIQFRQERHRSCIMLDKAMSAFTKAMERRIASPSCDERHPMPKGIDPATYAVIY